MRAIASRIPAILQFDTETGGDPFVKVKSFIPELINQLQDTLQRLDMNRLVENDEFELGHARDSEHFPVKKGRNLDPESEVFMARIFQICVSHFRSSGPGPRGRQISDETNRPEQSKQGQLWVRYEGKTRAVDLGGTAEEMRERVHTATKQTGEGEVYVTSQVRRETWESVAAMEDGRAIEVTVKMNAERARSEAGRTGILGTRYRPKANLRKYDQEAVRRTRQMSNRCKRSCRERLLRRGARGDIESVRGGDGGGRREREGGNDGEIRSWDAKGAAASKTDIERAVREREKWRGRGK